MYLYSKESHFINNLFIYLYNFLCVQKNNLFEIFNFFPKILLILNSFPLFMIKKF